MKPRPAWLLAALLLLAPAGRGLSAPRINEFLANNAGGLRDEDGSTPDWIELYNPGPDTVNLLNWSLTDVATNLTKWRFPPTNIAPGGFVIVFASDKNHRVPGRPLHANFRLNDGGEYLALVGPDGTNVVSEFAPAFRPQFPNVSFGVAAAETVQLLAPDAPLRAFVPVDDSLGTAWRNPGFDDSAWTSGSGGAGYENAPEDYAGLIGTDLRAAMSGLRTSACVRIPFRVDNPSSITGLRLKAQYDDGFVLWINGQAVANRNAPDPLAWDSASTGDHPDGLAVVAEEIDLRAAATALVPGTNVVAIQLLNVRAGSSDALVRVALEADRTVPTSGTGMAFFPAPTPGAVNRNGLGIPGPVLRDLARTPAAVTATNAVTVTVRTAPVGSPVTSVTLTYRVQYGFAATVAMADDGRHGDGPAGDGVWGAEIPAGVAQAGLMVRFRVTATDASGRTSRLPLFPDPADSEEWSGYVVQNPAIRSRLDVLHLFVEDTGASESFAGTRCSIAFAGEFYDNVAIRLHGQSSSGFPKHSHNLDFPRDHRFKPATNLSRVKDLKLLTNYGDKSRLHNALAYETIAAAGGAGHFSFPVRVQRNGAFHAILDMMEDADERWLERLGRPPDSALYKMYDALESVGGAEKKTRKDEDTTDLQDLISNLAPSRPLATRAAWAWDNVDLPQCVGYCVGLALASSQDHGHKNFYVCRDSTGSGDWTLFPWDVDLTFGRNWLDSQGYFTDTLYTNNVLGFYNDSQQSKPANRFYDLLFNNPDFRRMYLRRLRTVVDELLPPTGSGNGFVGQRIAYWLDRMDPRDITPSDTALDEARWTPWGVRRTTRQEAQRILETYLPGRRAFLLASAAARLAGEPIPGPQPTNPAVRIDQVDFRPASGRAFEEYLRLTNAEPVAIDLSGWTLRGEVRHRFRPGTVIPAGRTLHVARDVAAFRSRTTSPKRGEGVFVQGNYSGQLSARGGWLELVDPAGAVVSRFEYAGNPTAWQQGVHVSEVMFHPPAPAAGSAFEDEDFEFLELASSSSEPLDLSGLRITEGVFFEFAAAGIRTLLPGGRILLARNTNAFALRYGTALPLAGQYYGGLSNAGDTLRMEDAVGEVVFEFRYRPEAFPSADGRGLSLETVRPDPDLDATNAWRLSPVVGGTPGYTAWPITVTGLRLDADAVAVRLPAEAGRRYSLQQNGRVNAPGWQRVGEAVRASTDGALELRAPQRAAPASFYRAAEAP